MDSTLLAIAALEGVGRDGEDQQEYAQGSPGDADQQAILHRLHIDHEQQKEEGEPDKKTLVNVAFLKCLFMYVTLLFTLILHCGQNRQPLSVSGGHSGGQTRI